MRLGGPYLQGQGGTRGPASTPRPTSGPLSTQPVPTSSAPRLHRVDMHSGDIDESGQLRREIGQIGSTFDGRLRRRSMGMLAVGAAASVLGLGPEPAEASKLPAFADSAWEAMGGGGADLYFPDMFLGVWDVTSVLTKLDTPMGEEFVPDMKQVQRAATTELNQATRFQVKFVRNEAGKVIFDRRFNTASLISMYYGDSLNMDDRITWNPEDPNVLLLALPKGLIIRTRVTRRSEDIPEPDRIETSEYIEQVFDDGVSTSPKVKASQCFTKYKWREMTPDLIAANGPGVIATQVVSDFLTPYDGDELYIRAMNKPVVQYTYKMQFRPAGPGKS